MAQTIQIANATYPDVPSIVCNKSGGGTAIFADPSGVTAQAADVASGKYFLTSAGVLTEGTASGGGGADRLVLLKEESLGNVNGGTSTSAVDMEKSIVVGSANSPVNAYDLLVIETSVDTKTNGRHASTNQLIWLTASSTIATKDATVNISSTLNCRISSGGVTTTKQSATRYGVYVNSASISNGIVTLAMYRRYNASQTSTINGNYTTRVYGINLYNLIGG